MVCSTTSDKSSEFDDSLVAVVAFLFDETVKILLKYFDSELLVCLSVNIKLSIGQNQQLQFDDITYSGINKQKLMTNGHKIQNDMKLNDTNTRHTKNEPNFVSTNRSQHTLRPCTFVSVSVLVYLAFHVSLLLCVYYQQFLIFTIKIGRN